MSPEHIRLGDGEGRLVCDVCGVSSDEKNIKRSDKYTKFGHYFCSKHFSQLWRHGKIIDPSRRTTSDKNEYILYDDHAEMILRSRDNHVDAVILIDLDDVDRCMAHKWSIDDRVRGKIRRTPYARGRINGKNVRLHRFILGYTGGLVIDHINRNSLDNRKCNLRIVTPAINSANRNSQKAYQTPNGKYRSYMKRDGRYITVGTFATKAEAASAWDKAANEYIQGMLSAINDSAAS